MSASIAGAFMCFPDTVRTAQHIGDSPSTACPRNVSKRAAFDHRPHQAAARSKVTTQRLSLRPYSGL
ncbi:protein of unknown function [Pararobbsia alpina]